MPSKDLTLLRRYTKFCSIQTVPFPCRYCNQSILAKHYEKHCTQRHHLIARLQCVWCNGTVSWESKFKGLHTDHLLQCCRTFLKIHAPSSRPPTQSTFDITPLCPARDLFGKTYDFQLGAYEPVCPLTLPPSPLYILDSLNMASACIQYYLENRDRTDWNHIIVRSIAFQSFLEAMHEGSAHTLPFSTWCDGGHYAQDYHRQHRHFIAVSPKDQFVSSVWSKVKIPSGHRPNKNFRCIHKKPIQSALHLLNTLGYVSQSRSSCEFATKTDRAHHYYIFETLPKDYRHALCILWPDGQRELLDQEYRNLKWDELLRSNLVFQDQKWHLRVKDIPGIRLGMILPFALNTSRKPTPHFIHLLNGQKLYFRRHGGGRHFPPFYDSEALWSLRPFYQRLCHAFRFYVEAYTEQDNLTQQMEAWKQKYESTERERRLLAEQLIASHTKNDTLNKALLKLNAELNSSSRSESTNRTFT